MTVHVKREKFATQVDRDVLALVRQLAKDEGRQLQAIVEDALKAFIEQRAKSRTRPHVMSAYQTSIARYSSLYENLAK